MDTFAHKHLSMAKCTNNFWRLKKCWEVSLKHNFRGFCLIGFAHKLGIPYYSPVKLTVITPRETGAEIFDGTFIISGYV